MFENKEELIQYLKANHLWTDKSLGQNFLVDNDALAKIVEAGEIKSTDTIIEIGPGLGVLTEELAEKARKVIAIEIDPKIAQLLNCSIAGVANNGTMKPSSNVEVINANALDFDLATLSSRTSFGISKDKKMLKQVQHDKKSGYKLIANIPYYITSKILNKFLTARKKPELIVLLVQKEVAERICARAGGMSVLSVSVQAYGEPEIIDIVPASSFFPAPKVDSAILKVKSIKWKVESVGEKDFFRTVKIGYAARRKTLLNNLSAGFRIDKETILNILKTVELNENVRAQELAVEDWEALTVEILKFKPRI